MISVLDILAEKPIKYKNIKNAVLVSEKIENNNRVENGDIVFVRSSEVAGEVGWAKAYLDDEYALFSGFSIRGKKKATYDAHFIQLALNGSNRKQIESKAGGSTRFNVSQGILNEVRMLQPSIEEQTKVGAFFSHLDSLIALPQHLSKCLYCRLRIILKCSFPQIVHALICLCETCQMPHHLVVIMVLHFIDNVKVNLLCRCHA